MAGECGAIPVESVAAHQPAQVAERQPLGSFGRAVRRDVYERVVAAVLLSPALLFGARSRVMQMNPELSTCMAPAMLALFEMNEVSVTVKLTCQREIAPPLSPWQPSKRHPKTAPLEMTVIVDRLGGELRVVARTGKGQRR
jgi:hypothetical protein